MRILALDPACKCGFAHSCGDSGVWILDAAGTEHSGNKLVRLERHILEIHERDGIDQIAFESAAFGSKFLSTKQFHNEVRGVIVMTAAKIGASYVAFVPTSIKKFATDDGKASKLDMIRAIKLHYGLDVRDEDECDAIWVLKMAEQRAGNPVVAALAAQKKPAPRRRTKKEARLF
jgi:Holliday junction resolvasome RuvABC endonuclease subunit